MPHQCIMTADGSLLMPADGHLRLHNKAEKACSGCWSFGSVSINTSHAPHRLPNRGIWFTHFLHVSVQWCSELNRTCARTKTREIPCDTVFSRN